MWMIVIPLVIRFFDLLLSVFPPKKAVVVDRVWGFMSAVIWALHHWCLSTATRWASFHSTILEHFNWLNRLDIYILYIPSPLVKWFPAALKNMWRVLGRWVIGLINILVMIIRIDQNGERIRETMEDGLGQILPFHGQIWLGVVVHD